MLQRECCDILSPLTEIDQELAHAFALSNGERHNATEVVVWIAFFLGKVADKGKAFLVSVAQDVEQEGLDVIVQCFVVEKHLGQQA